MTNQLAVILGLILAAGIGVDLVLLDGANLLFLGKKLFALIDWMAFWR